MQPMSMSDADHRDSDRRENRKRELISQEAAEWFARMKGPHVPLDERRRFLRWLKQSQIHVAEYLRVTGVDGSLRRAHLTLALGENAPSNIVQLFAGEKAEPSDIRPLRWKIAATIAACGLTALLLLAVRTAWYERSIETDLGEWKTVTLADGSQLQLGPNTRLTLDFGDTQRSIGLVRGEAYFKVAKDVTRPFLVEANAYAVKAVGTQFAVSHRQDELIVTVSEGEVRVTPSTKSTKRSAGADQSVELSVPITADYQLRIADTWPVMPSRIDVRYELAWREKQLMFKAGDTLADAVEEFNWRNRVQLRLDPRAADLPVRGSFDASDPLSFAQTVDKTSPVAVRRLAADTLLINAE
jgi:Fe2+-dicitrate sensor, membrane component